MTERLSHGSSVSLWDRLVAGTQAVLGFSPGIFAANVTLYAVYGKWWSLACAALYVGLWLEQIAERKPAEIVIKTQGGVRIDREAA